MKKNIIYTISSLVLGLIFTSFIYNFDVVLNIFSLLYGYKIFIYTCITIFYFFLFLFLSKKISAKPSLLFLISVITPIAIDFIIIISNKALFPLRFPFSSIFPLSGAALGLIYLNRSRFLFGVSICIFLFFLYSSHVYFIPKFTFYAAINSSAKLKENIFEYNFYTINGDKILLRDTNNAKCTTIECFFKGCAPCERKIVDLRLIQDSINSNQAKFIFICDGSITNYKDFQNYSKTHVNDGFTFLYDKDSVLNKVFNIHGYPFEFFLKKEVLIGTTVGYDDIISKEYIKSKINKIKTILDEKNN